MQIKKALHPGISLSALFIYVLCAVITVSALAAFKQLPSPHTEDARVGAGVDPFMHRPFYGTQTVLQRARSLFDHDQPTYVQDGVFVRYDGTSFTNVSITDCTPGVNCYDGHNGYDLSMQFEPVLSAAAGNVIRAGWYNPVNHNDAFGLWAAIDHGNGIATVYGHLSALEVTNGQHVGVQWQIGTSGTTGSSTGPHLHMGTYYLNDVAWQATDPFGWSGNYADKAKGEINGDLHWAFTTSGSATATATWQPTIPKDGTYEVGVFVDETYASSSWVPYTVYSANPANKNATRNQTLYVDESHIGNFTGPYGALSTGPQWIGLGTFYFKAGTSGRVVLSNATGEDGQVIAADAVEFVPVP